MATVRRLLEANPSLSSIYTSIDILKDRLIYIGNLLEENVDFQINLLGVNLAKVSTTNLSDIITIDSDGNYTFSSGHKIIISAQNIISDNTDLVKHSDVLNFLSDYAKQKNIFTKAIPKNSDNGNVFNKSEVLSLTNVYKKKEAPIYIENAETLLNGVIEDESLINFSFFKSSFFNTQNSVTNVSLTITDGDNTDFNILGQATIKDSTIKEIMLDYTKAEITGAGVKLSDFIENQKAIESTPGVYKVLIKALSPEKNVLTINGQTYTYAPDPSNDTADDVSDNITGDMDIDGVSVQQDEGYYSATPMDQDNEYKIAWYVKDTTDSKSYSVTLQTDESSDHDLEVNWDSDNNKLTVTYPSQNSKSLPVKLGDLMDAVANVTPAFYIAIVKPGITKDTDYFQSFSFDLDENDLTSITFTSDKEPLSISYTPSNIADVSTEQKFIEGKHQKGNIGCVRFERGHKFSIKIDKTEMDIDLTDDTNYPKIQNSHELMDEFNSLINSNKLPFTTTLEENNLILLASDYSEHTITTSGASKDYTAPLPRTVTVVSDLQDIVKQGEQNIVLYKESATSLDKVSLNTPITQKDIELYSNLGLFASEKIAANLTINNSSYFNDKELPKMADVYNAAQELLAINSNIFPTSKLEYISNYDIFINGTLNFPKSEIIGSWKILTDTNGNFIHAAQLNSLDQIGIDAIQETLIGFSDNYLSDEIKQISPYIKNKKITTLNDLKTTENNIKGSIHSKKYFELNKANLADAYNPLYPVIYNEDIKNIFEKLLDIKNEDYQNVHDKIAWFDEYEYKINEAALKHTLFAFILAQQSPNALMQLSWLLSEYYFSEEDILLHIDNSYLRDTILNISVADPAPTKSNGLEGQLADGTLSFSNLYIRQYKKTINDINSGTNASDYIKIDINSLPTVEKLLLCFPMPFGIYDSKNKKIVYYKDNLNYDVNYEKWSRSEERITTVFDNMAYKDNVINGLFPTKDYLINQVGSGLTKYNDTIWNLLLKGITPIKDPNDGLVIKGVQDSLSTIRMLYKRYSNITSWELAYFLSGNWGGLSLDVGYPGLGDIDVTIKNNGLFTNESALMLLCIKCWIYIEKNNIAASDYLSTFQKIVGIIFKNDDTATGILPDDIFNAFLGTIGAADYIQDAADVSADLPNHKLGINLGHYTLTFK